MSFTAEVKKELARIEEGDAAARVAELSALSKACGTLSFSGSGTYSLKVRTETASAARVFIKLSHGVFGLETDLTIRQSLLHRSGKSFRKSYLIEVSDQEGLERALQIMGIVQPGRGLSQGVPARFLRVPQVRAAYLRGAFMGSGFVADPRGDFAIEFLCEGEPYAEGLCELLACDDITMRINRRRQAFAVYSKNFDDITRLLSLMGAHHITLVLENMRALKSLKNDVNRTVNAELANQKRAVGAAQEQLALIDRVYERLGEEAVPAKVREFCELRRRYPDLTLRELGERATPALSKSAVYHRLLRLQALDAPA